MKYNHPDDENDESACSSKENFLPLNYYTESMATNIDGENEYNTVYSNTPVQSNEHFPYPSRISSEKQTLIMLFSLS